jgi:hypothetical protein
MLLQSAFSTRSLDGTLTMDPLADWEIFRSFPDQSAAAALCGQLGAGGCPATFEPRALANALGTEYCVFVPKSLAHRARWVVAQLPVSDAELDFLATGKLPGDGGDGAV